MNVLIIDDTRLARKELRHLLTQHEDIVILDEAENAEEALPLIEQHNPDLIFLDIQMPGKNGFELLEELLEAPEVIFTTAYNEYAVKAFEHNALDYLQKPIADERLALALDKVRAKLTPKRNEGKELLSENSRVFVKSGERCWFVSLQEISLFEVYGSYTQIYFHGEKPMIPRTLNYLETRLDARIFFRANRQQIINTKWISRIEPWFSGTIRIYLQDGTEVEVSRRQTAKFKELMSF